MPTPAIADEELARRKAVIERYLQEGHPPPGIIIAGFQGALRMAANELGFDSSSFGKVMTNMMPGGKNFRRYREKQSLFPDWSLWVDPRVQRGTLSNLAADARRGAHGYDPVLPGFMIRETATTYDADGEVRQQRVTQTQEPGPRFAVPLGHSVKGVTARIDPNGQIREQYIKTRAGDAAIEDVIASLKAAFSDIPAALPVSPPLAVDDDLLTIYPLADAHIGMMAYGKETGESYDANIATDRIRSWVARAVAASPSSAVAVILDVGDLTHADDDTNLTPRSKHPLTVDSRHFRTLDVTIAALASAIECALQKHAKVIVRILPGNHNQTSYMAVMFALSERYRNEPRVEVQKVPGEFFVMEFGSVMLAAHHGHGGKPDRLVHFLADEYAPIWGRAVHRFLWTGHLHHMKAQDIGGVTWEQLRAISARDAYSVSKAYTGRAQLQAITLHRLDGEVQRVKIGANFRNE